MTFGITTAIISVRTQLQEGDRSHPIAGNNKVRLTTSHVSWCSNPSVLGFCIMTSINPLKLPSVHLSELKKLPDCTAIYFAIDSENRILYVGQAANLALRWRNHHRQYQLEEIDKTSTVRVAWLAWNSAGLDEAEKTLIKHFHPLLNGTEVESPAIIPSEVILRDFLKAFSRRLIIIGMKPKTTNELPNVYLKYDWTDCSLKGTAAKIKNFIQQNKDKNTSLKFQWQKYIRIRNEVVRPGSRLQKVIALRCNHTQSFRCALSSGFNLYSPFSISSRTLPV